MHALKYMYMNAYNGIIPSSEKKVITSAHQELNV